MPQNIFDSRNASLLRVRVGVKMCPNFGWSTYVPFSTIIHLSIGACACVCGCVYGCVRVCVCRAGLDKTTIFIFDFSLYGASVAGIHFYCVCV